MRSRKRFGRRRKVKVLLNIDRKGGLYAPCQRYPTQATIGRHCIWWRVTQVQVFGTRMVNFCRESEVKPKHLRNTTSSFLLPKTAR